MSIVENRATELGDIILIKAQVPIVGLVLLSSFVDSTVNETQTKFFKKEFRYSLDGINYTTWIELTNPNIASIQLVSTDIFYIEYRYRRVGLDSSNPPLEFNQVEITGEYSTVECGDAFKNSIFSQFLTCTDVCVLSWMINVLEKLYKKGILPEYIIRDKGNNQFSEDRDFLDLWRSITQYFAYIVCYARKWELSSVTGNYGLLQEYLQNQTFILCGGEAVEDLLYIMNNTYDEMRHRGTNKILDIKGPNVSVDGEFHRLFCHLNKCTDWYFTSTDNYKVGWVIDSASPLYKGNYSDRGLTKAYENSRDVVDLLSYPLEKEEYIGIQSDLTNEGEFITVASIKGVPAGEVSGIGGLNTDKLIKVGSKFSYEISFWVKMNENTALTVSLDLYNKDKNLYNPPPTKSTYFDTSKSLFIDKVKTCREDKWYKVRCILYRQRKKVLPGELFEDYLLSGVNAGLPLGHYNSTTIPYDLEDKLEVMESANMTLTLSDKVCYIQPNIILDNSEGSVVSGEMKLYDIKVRHLSTDYSTGFEESSSLIKSSVENFNLKYTNIRARALVREFLIPYNSELLLDFVSTPEVTNIKNVHSIITKQDVRWTSPGVQTSNVKEGDRYLVYDSGMMLLYEFSAGYWTASSDNSQGSVVYIESNKCTYKYESGTWLFSLKN